MATQKCNRYKAAWARRKAASLRAQAEELRAQHVPAANWRNVKRKMQALVFLSNEARRFERMAQGWDELVKLQAVGVR